MRDECLYAGSELALVPGFLLLGRRLGGEHGRLDASFAQDQFEPPVAFALLCKGRRCPSREYGHAPDETAQCQTRRSVCTGHTPEIPAEKLEHFENGRLRPAHIQQAEALAGRKRERRPVPTTARNGTGIILQTSCCLTLRTRRRREHILASGRMCMIQVPCLRAFGAHA
jgi:hypothetical protein